MKAIKSLSIEEGRWYLLDGHFCLLNNEGIISKIPEETFINLSPRGIILLTDSIENISYRLNDRDNIKYDYDL